MHALMSDIARSCRELRHVDMSRVAVGYAQARHSRTDGTRATIHPLRFPGGRRAARRRGHTFRMPEVVIDGTEILYVVTYTLPYEVELPTRFYSHMALEETAREFADVAAVQSRLGDGVIQVTFMRIEAEAGEVIGEFLNHVLFRSAQIGEEVRR